MPWQEHLANLALECDDDGHLIYREVRVTVPRQSGKSTLVLAKNVQRMVDAGSFGGRQRLVYTAQDRLSAKAKLMDDWAEDLKGCRRFNGRWKPRRTIGEESIRWSNGSIWGVQANKETSGHGGTLDVGDVDEAFSHVDDRVEQALSPAMVTRRDAQLWVISTAGTIERSLYLKGKVDSGRQLAEAGIDKGVAYIEYSAPDGTDLDDPATWWTFMPALGFTTTEEIIAAERAKMTPGGFARAYGNLWVPARYGDQVIPADDWAACLDEDSQITGRTYVLGVDVAPGSSWASIAVAGYREDGLPHAEVVEHRAGDDWLVDRLVEIRTPLGRDVPVILDPTSPAGAKLADLRKAKIEPITVGAREVAQACGALKSTTKAHKWRHIGQDVLTDALQGAATRQLLDSWAFKRTSSSCDISPLYALTFALHGLSTAPEQRQRTEEELLASVG